MADLRAAAVTGQQAHHRREVAPGAFPHHPGRRRRLPGTARAQARGVLRRPHQGRVAVVHGGGEPVDRRQPVVHGNHHGAHGHRGGTAHPVGQPQVAEDEPAAVEVKDQRPGTCGPAGRPVDPHRDVPGRPVDGPVAHLGPGQYRSEDAVEERVGRGVTRLHRDDLGLGLRADRVLLHQPCPQPHPAIDRRHPRSVPASRPGVPARRTGAGARPARCTRPTHCREALTCPRREW